MEADWLTAERLAALRLAFDSAALVLIWLVQLVIYPVFTYLARTDFARWHPVYTRRVTLVVLPVMVGQVIIYGLSLVTGTAHWTVWLNAGIIALVWGITFFRAVPLHALLDAPDLEDHVATAVLLNRINAWRVGVWTVVWGISVAVFSQGL